jgi:hypothetical protein
LSKGLVPAILFGQPKTSIDGQGPGAILGATVAFQVAVEQDK